MSRAECEKEELTNRGALREVPLMGVIYVVHEASKLGFYNGNPEWSNLGQGQPEVGEMEGAPKRIMEVTLEPTDHAYGPLGGNGPFKEAVANHYNRLYRGGKTPYAAENVTACSGGRLALSRVFAALGVANIGYMTPDYPAYEDMFNYHLQKLVPFCFQTKAEDSFQMPSHLFEQFIVDNKLNAFLISNPCNPTGKVVEGEELRKYVAIARKHNCTLILDEFYSHFIFNPDGEPGEGPVSAAQYVEDINTDPILIIDGLTKNFRYPGWRVGWVVGPKDMVSSIDRAASAIDGGPPQPVQRAALKALEPSYADQEVTALRKVFSRKRAIMTKRLTEMGIRCITGLNERGSTFYIWASVADLPAPLDDGFGFFKEALKHKVMTVPGSFFDVNPGKTREPSLSSWVRFSFGPPEHNLVMGLDRLQKMVESFN